MHNLGSTLRYTLRQFRMSPVFTVAATLTLALGIGGTTAIFTIMHEAMLRSLPVSDPALLYRVGDGDDCCVEGGPQDRWGMFSFPLYERLRAETPEFEEVTAFQAGGWRISVRREGVESAARPLRSEFVTGSYFSTFGVGAFGGRVFAAADDTSSAPPVAVLSHHVWEGTYGGDVTMVGSTLVVEGHPFTVIGLAPPGFFGETLRSDPPDIWLPLQQEPMLQGENSLLRQPIGAWLRMIGRLRSGASVAGMAPRLTGVLRQWIQHDSGYPANWMPDVIRILPKQVISVVPAGAGVGVMKEEYGRSLQILLAVCGLVLLIACANVANLLLARAVARRAQTAVRLAIGATRAQIVTQALVESVLLAVSLVAGSTMLARSLNKLEHQNFGYQIQDRVVVSLNRPPATYTQPKLAALYRQIEERLNRLPGVRGVGLALYNPLTDNWGEMVLVAGHPAAKISEDGDASWDRVSADYLQNFGMMILRGRAFAAADNETTAPVAVVNEAFAKRFFKSDEDPLGQHFGLDLPENVGTFRIVGIVRDAKFAGFALNRPARPMFYVPLAQNVDYQHPVMKRIELQPPFLGWMMLGAKADPVRGATRAPLALS